ncbi:MAG: S8 family serine peptidase [Vulcanimicrobiota bacterium]
MISRLPASNPARNYVEGEVLVKLKRGIFQSDDRFADSYGARTVERFDFPRDIFKSFEGDLVRLELPEGLSAADAVERMSEDPRVDYAVTNDIYTLDERQTPNDLDPKLWGMEKIKAPEAWDTSTGSPQGPLVAILDTGLDYHHPDLKNNVWTNAGEIPGDGIDNDGNGVIDDVHGFNAFANSGNPMDGHSHGTHVAGTIAAEGNNGQGVVGVNWRARLMPVKIFDDSGSTTTDAILRGILYASKMGARITSNSWGGGGANQAIAEAFRNSPALHIMAAGNNSSNNDRNPHYPSNYDLPNSIAVASTDSNDRLSSFSNYGATSVDLAAPGGNIYSTMPGGGYGHKSGTSMATPHVSGVAALLASAYPEMSNDELKTRILQGVDQLPSLRGKVATGGRLNAANALDNDRLPPAAPGDLSLVEAGSSQVKLRWTATGDDGWCGQASSYDLRMANQPITDLAGFESARPVETGLPGRPESLEQVSVRITPSASERQLYFGLRVRDNVGNASELRSVAAQIPATSLVFEDNFDQPNQAWQADGKWGRVESNGRGSIFSDSPTGDYDNQANSSLTSPTIDLSQVQGSTLLFEARHALEQGYDKVHLEASKDGQSWQPLKDFTGSEEWHQESIDLSGYDGGSVQLRFRLESDQSVTADGFSLDNLVVAGDRTGQTP